jgi:hypothetical protein
MLRFPHKISDGLEAELYALLQQLDSATAGQSGSTGSPGDGALAGDQIMDQQEKAERWDHLVELLKSPGLQDTYVFHLSKLRRATLMLLASREELPVALVVELTAYRARLDALYLEAKDGFTDLEGILNAIPAHAIGSVVGELSQPDTGE